MKWVLLLVLGVGGALAVTASTILLLVRHRLHRRNRVDHRHPNGIPLSWLVDPRLGARLHRRLVRAGHAAEAVALQHQPTGRKARRGDPPMIVELARELHRYAAELDARLGATRHLPPPARVISVRQLQSGVAEIEASMVRLTALSIELVAPPLLPRHAQDLAELGQRIELLIGAHRELGQVDAANGLLPNVPVNGAPVVDVAVPVRR